MRLAELLTESPMPLTETISGIHRTSRHAAAAIRWSGFTLDNFGKGAGAGSGEPAGIFISTGDGEDFAREVRDRDLRLDTVIAVQVRIDPTQILDWTGKDDERIAFVKEARIALAMETFDLDRDDAQRVLRGSVMNRPELRPLFIEICSPEYERKECLHLNRTLHRQGYKAVRYRDRFQRVDQLIVLDPKVIKVVD